MIDMFGGEIPEPVIPFRQLTMFDISDYSSGFIGMSAVIRRESGEKSHGTLGTLNLVNDRRLTFIERETGKTYSIPLRCCTITWADGSAVVAISDREMNRNTALWGMFASCRLF